MKLRSLAKTITALTISVSILAVSQLAFAIGSFEWTTLLPTERAEHTEAVYNGKIYLIGGIDNNLNTLGTVHAYSPSPSPYWDTSVDNLNTPRKRAASATLNGKIYVAGGYGTNYLKSCEVYDPNTNEWTPIQDLNIARQNAELVAFNNKLYCIGGDGNNGIENTVEEYNPTNNTWTIKTSRMSSPRADFSAALVSNKIYVLGGATGSTYSATDSILEYDPATDTWTNKSTKLLAPTKNSACAVYNGSIYLFGGYNPDTGRIHKTEVYNPSANSIAYDQSMIYGRSHLTAATLGGNIYVMGGRPISGYGYVIAWNQKFTPGS